MIRPAPRHYQIIKGKATWAANPTKCRPAYSPTKWLAFFKNSFSSCYCTSKDISKCPKNAQKIRSHPKWRGSWLCRSFQHFCRQRTVNIAAAQRCPVPVVTWLAPHQRKGHAGLRRQWFRLVSIMLKASCNSNITTTQRPWQTCTTSQPCHAHRRHCLTQRLAKLKHYFNTGPAPLSDIVPSARNEGLLNLRKPGRIQTGTISMHKLARNGPEPLATSSQLHRL